MLHFRIFKKKVRADLVVRALGSAEGGAGTKASSPLDRLGREVAKVMRAKYDPTRLKKSRETRAMKLLTASERAEELADVYSFTGSPNGNSGDVLILDDILTTGATVRAVIKSIREVSRNCGIQIFTLAYTDPQALLNKSLVLGSYDYQWEPESGWSVMDGAENYTVEFTNLRDKILQDSLS
ncbi:MAG TPA: hypothetical protein VFW11_16850 [Cyclobacteriaceae bacterium]|nr:hypothetical protein [Cyclobacteriaceae bacterium]